MIKNREIFGIVPLICGILVIISLITSFFYNPVSNTRVWLIGLQHDIDQGIFSFPLRFDSLIKGIIVFFCFLCCAISLIRTFFMTWRAKWKATIIKRIWLITGLVLILISVINYVFLMLIPEATQIIMELGFYGPIIASIIAFIGLFFYRNV